MSSYAQSTPDGEGGQKKKAQTPKGKKRGAGRKKKDGVTMELRGGRGASAELLEISSRDDGEASNARTAAAGKKEAAVKGSPPLSCFHEPSFAMHSSGIPSFGQPELERSANPPPAKSSLKVPRLRAEKRRSRRAQMQKNTLSKPGQLVRRRPSEPSCWVGSAPRTSTGLNGGGGS